MTANSMLRPSARACADRLEHAGDDVLGDVGQPLRELLDRAEPEDGRERQPQDLAAAGRAQRCGRGFRRGVAGQDGAGLLAQQRGRARTQLVLRLQPGHGLGDAAEQLAGEPRARQHPGETLGRTGGVAQHPEDTSASTRGLR